MRYPKNHSGLGPLQTGVTYVPPEVTHTLLPSRAGVTIAGMANRTFNSAHSEIDEFVVEFIADESEAVVEVTAAFYGPHHNGDVPIVSPAYTIEARATRPAGQIGPWEGRLTYKHRPLGRGEFWAIRLFGDIESAPITQTLPESE